MRSDTQQAGRRKRGGRRHRGPRTSEGNGSSVATSPKAPAKKGFFQRIIAFFTGGSAKEQPGKVYGRVLDGTENDRPTTRPSSQPSAESAPRREAAAPRPPKPARKPELLEVTSAKLYVGNLSFDAAESDLTELFSGVGSVQNSEVVSHRETQKSKGFAFVTMTSLDEAKRAVLELHDKEFMGRRLVVSGAKTPDVRS